MRYVTVPLVLVLLGCHSGPRPPRATWAPEVAPLPRETHLASLRQLTSAGTYAEAYWSPDGAKLILQAQIPPGSKADQIYELDLATGEKKLLSTGWGKCT